VAIGSIEVSRRRELAALGDPERAPDWLRPVWVHRDPRFVLYRLQQE
jgi:hypothetical protein